MRKKKDSQLKSFEELVVLFLGPALSGLGDGVGLPDLLARPVWGRSHWLGSRRAGVDHVACFALRSNSLNEWIWNKQAKEKHKVWRAGLCVYVRELASEFEALNLFDPTKYSFVYADLIVQCVLPSSSGVIECGHCREIIWCSFLAWLYDLSIRE